MKDLNYEFDPNKIPTLRYTGCYEPEKLKDYLNRNHHLLEEEMLNDLQNCDIDSAILKLDNHLHEAHRSASIKRTRIALDRRYMEEANIQYNNYQRSLKGQSNDTPDQAYSKYQSARNALNKDLMTRENDKWNSLLNEKNSKKLWSRSLLIVIPKKGYLSLPKNY